MRDAIIYLMHGTTIFEWQATEYIFQEKNADWYWALGIIALAAVIACVLFSNVLLALVVLAGASAVALQAARHPRTHTFRILDTGVAIDDSLYLYRDMYDFSVLEYLDPSFPPALSIKTRHIFAPHLLIPIDEHDPLEIYDYVSEHLPEGMHEETFADRVAHFLKFY